MLAAYLAAGGNKAAAAKAANLARPTFYDRLGRIERILGTDLRSAESRTSLHVALLALTASRADAGPVDYGTNTLHRLRPAAAWVSEVPGAEGRTASVSCSRHRARAGAGQDVRRR